MPAGQNVTKFAFLSLSKHSNESMGKWYERVNLTTINPFLPPKNKDM